VTVELIASEPLSLGAIGRVLGPRLTLGAGVETSTERVFYDTFDGLLYEAGLTHCAAPEVPPRQSLSAEGREAIGVRALLPVAHVRVRSSAAPLLDSLQKTVAKVSIERLTLPQASRRHRRLRTRVVLEPLRGYDSEVQHARRLLSAKLELSDADQTLRDEAAVALGADPAGISSTVQIALTPTQRADQAAGAVLSRLHQVVEQNLPGTLDDIDSEFLHDYRVAVRKARTVLREFSGVFPPERLTALRGELKWLQEITGQRRDLDVYVLDFEKLRALVPAEQQPQLEPVKHVLSRRRGSAHTQMLKDLSSRRAAKAMRAWTAILEYLPRLSEDDRPDAGRTIDEVCSERIRVVYRRMLKMGEAITPASDPEAYHELRKQGKELRYLLELFGQPLHDSRVVKPMVKALKDLQDVLGRHQDRDIQATMLRGLADEVDAQPGSAHALMAMGVLVQRLEDDAVAARAEFARSFKAFSSREQRELVKETFRG
jgi:CHAD domain-containing protein